MEFKSLNRRPDPENNPNEADRRMHPEDRAASGASFHRPRTLRSIAPWAAWVALAIVLAGLATLGWTRLDRQAETLAGMIPRERIEALEIEIRSFDERLSALAGRTAASAAVDDLAVQVAALERSLGTAIDRTAADLRALEASVAAVDAEIPRRIEDGLEQGTSATRERLGELEAALLERDAELGDFVARIENLRQEVRLGLTDLESRGDMVGRGFENRVANAERRLDVVAYAVDRDRVDFETFTDYSDELAPGIRLHVTDIDRRMQRISGWLHLVPEGRIVRISEYPIQQSFVFYTLQDERAHELVFTRVTRTAAVGYLRVPPESLVDSADADWAGPSVALAAQ